MPQKSVAREFPPKVPKIHQGERERGREVRGRKNTEYQGHQPSVIFKVAKSNLGSNRQENGM